MTVDNVISDCNAAIDVTEGEYKLSISRKKLLTLIAEIERLRAREKSARVCGACIDCRGAIDGKIGNAGCKCEGAGIVWDG